MSVMAEEVEVLVGSEYGSQGCLESLGSAGSFGVIRLDRPLLVGLVLARKRKRKRKRKRRWDCAKRLVAWKSPRLSDLLTRGMLSFCPWRLRGCRLGGISRPALRGRVWMVGVPLSLLMVLPMVLPVFPPGCVESRVALRLCCYAATRGSKTPSLNLKNRS